MIVVEGREPLRQALKPWHAQRQRIALVPTMGNLHAGHLALVRAARAQAERVLVSIFVNPLQFGPNEDFTRYPRTLDEDRKQLQQAGADLLFAPTDTEIYPNGQDNHTQVVVPGLSDELCGAARPGHFVGVATVVCKLFNLVQPHLALFGEKDFQQLLIIRRMVADLDLPVEILGIPTQREADGLAMSSRNRYLNNDERLRAPLLYGRLELLAAEVRAGARDFKRLERKALSDLVLAGFHPEYVSVRRAEDLQPPGSKDRQLVVLAAARLGKTRLIDNLRIESSA